MRIVRLLVILLISSSIFAQDPAVRLWAVSDGVRVSPVTSNLIESRPFVHSDYPAGNPRRGNLVWDAANKTVMLKAARNEFTAFQLIIETWEPQNQIDVKFASLAHEGGTARIDRRHIAIFKEWYIQVRRPTTGYERSSLGPDWYPDALMPYREAGRYPGFPFSIPDIHNNIPNQKNHAVWIDVFIPFERAAAPPGRYSGTVEVTWQGGRDSIRVALDVWTSRCRRRITSRGIFGTAP